MEKNHEENVISMFVCVRKAIKQTQEFCAERKIQFPKIDFKKLESEPIREVYVFEDEENPEVPIVIHFPMINLSFKQFKAPGEFFFLPFSNLYYYHHFKFE